MKRVQLMLAVLMMAGLTLAQNTPQGQPQTPTTQTPPAQTGKTPPQAKTQEEYKAFQDATQAQDAATTEKAADDFSAKFKESELRYLLYYRAMLGYQDQNNAEKAIEMGRRVLAINPNEPITLAMVASFLAEKTRETDLDRDERLNEAMRLANKSLEVVDTELLIPPGTPQAAADASKNMLRSIAYSAIGNAYLAKNDFTQAEANLRKSIELTEGGKGDATLWLRYAIVLDRQKKYSDALVAANKAMDLSPAGSPQAQLAKQERERLLKLSGGSQPATQPAK